MIRAPRPRVSAPLNGVVLALVMSYKDGPAHEALFPLLIASVVSDVILGFFLGNVPLFSFAITAAVNGELKRPATVSRFPDTPRAKSAVSIRGAN
jgi:Na+/H+ antiporter NhaC